MHKVNISHYLEIVAVHVLKSAARWCCSQRNSTIFAAASGMKSVVRQLKRPLGS
jgi:hypothetical protein